MPLLQQQYFTRTKVQILTPEGSDIKKIKKGPTIFLRMPLLQQQLY
jgi:hypothetical protein